MDYRDQLNTWKVFATDDVEGETAIVDAMYHELQDLDNVMR